MRKLIFYGAVTLPDDMDKEDAGKAAGHLQEFLEEKLTDGGRIPNVFVNSHQSDYDPASTQPRPQKLIDGNNIDWSGLHYTGALAETMEYVLSRQKDVGENLPGYMKRYIWENHTFNGGHGYMEDRPCGDPYHNSYYNPCDGCSGMLCAECLYSGV